MILHCVYLETPEAAPTAALHDIMHGLSQLVGQIDGFTRFDHGPNIDLEGKSPEAPYGFICHFNDRTALARYAQDPRHRALGARLVGLCGGADRIKVYDIETGGI